MTQAELPPDPGSTWGRAATWGAVSGLVFAAFVIAAWGFLSLGLDRDVVALPGVSVLVAPLAAASATVLVAVWLAFGMRRRFEGRRSSVWLALPCAASAWLSFGLVAGAAAGATRGAQLELASQPPLASEVAVHLASGAFGLAVPVLAALVYIGMMAMTTRRADER